mmetsp:Transcript_22973/g.26611  ORF Transcript_22973/g.26611 Transcript_22973/m.26611 type:complete len:619 (+) Transcript_22973:135-1991(+)
MIITNNMENETNLHPNDVFLGRGGNGYKHAGNEKLRNLARFQVHRYMNSSKTQKTQISREIVSYIRNTYPPGRFLKRVRGRWEEVDEDMAREKASQALRDAVVIAQKTKHTNEQHHQQEAQTIATPTTNSQTLLLTTSSPYYDDRRKSPSTTASSESVKHQEERVHDVVEEERCPDDATTTLDTDSSDQIRKSVSIEDPQQPCSSDNFVPKSTLQLQQSPTLHHQKRESSSYPDPTNPIRETTTGPPAVPPPSSIPHNPYQESYDCNNQSAYHPPQYPFFHTPASSAGRSSSHMMYDNFGGRIYDHSTPPPPGDNINHASNMSYHQVASSGRGYFSAPPKVYNSSYNSGYNNNYHQHYNDYDISYHNNYYKRQRNDHSYFESRPPLSPPLSNTTSSHYGNYSSSSSSRPVSTSYDPAPAPVNNNNTAGLVDGYSFPGYGYNNQQHHHSAYDYNNTYTNHNTHKAIMRPITSTPTPMETEYGSSYYVEPSTIENHRIKNEEQDSREMIDSKIVSDLLFPNIVPPSRENKSGGDNFMMNLNFDTEANQQEQENDTLRHHDSPIQEVEKSQVSARQKFVIEKKYNDHHTNENIEPVLTSPSTSIEEIHNCNSSSIQNFFWG